MARGVIDAATAAGLAVPQDLTVVGFDAGPLAAACRPALTTVHQDVGAKGRAAAHALFEAMDAARGHAGGPHPHAPGHRLDT